MGPKCGTRQRKRPHPVILLYYFNGLVSWLSEQRHLPPSLMLELESLDSGYKERSKAHKLSSDIRMRLAHEHTCVHAHTHTWTHYVQPAQDHTSDLVSSWTPQKSVHRKHIEPSCEDGSQHAYHPHRQVRGRTFCSPVILKTAKVISNKGRLNKCSDLLEWGEA